MAEVVKTTELAVENVSRRLIELAEIKQDSKVLDIATGIGEPSITVAKKLMVELVMYSLQTIPRSQ